MCSHQRNSHWVISKGTNGSAHLGLLESFTSVLTHETQLSVLEAEEATGKSILELGIEDERSALSNKSYHPMIRIESLLWKLFFPLFII